MRKRDASRHGGEAVDSKEPLVKKCAKVIPIANHRKDDSGIRGPEPSPFTPEQREVLALLRWGFSVSRAMESLGFNRNAWNLWCRQTPAFREAAVLARERHQEEIADAFHESEAYARRLIDMTQRNENAPLHLRMRAALAIVQRGEKQKWLPSPLDDLDPERPTLEDFFPDGLPYPEESILLTADEFRARQRGPGTPDPAASISETENALHAHGASHSIGIAVGDKLAVAMAGQTGNGVEAGKRGPVLVSNANNGKTSNNTAGARKRRATLTIAEEDTAPAQPKGSKKPSRHSSVAVPPKPGPMPVPPLQTTPLETSSRDEETKDDTLPLTLDTLDKGGLDNAAERSISSDTVSNDAVSSDTVSNDTVSSGGAEPKRQESAQPAGNTASGNTAAKEKATTKRLDDTFLSRYAIHRHESASEFGDLVESLAQAYTPADRGEELLVLRIAQRHWALRRVEAFEMAISESVVAHLRRDHPDISPVAALALQFLEKDCTLEGRFLERMMRYRAEHERQLERLENQLDRFRQHRFLRSRHSEATRPKPDSASPFRLPGQPAAGKVWCPAS